MNSRAPLGMLLFLLNEAVLFFMLIAAYVYFHASATPSSRHLGLTAALVFTACLMASSVAMWRAAATGGRAWIGATIALGALFLYGQATEYWRLFRQNITISGDQFGATFFTVTGVHALHVSIGLLLLALLLRGTASRAMTDSIALYWYFVDGVWIVIFIVVYLWTFL